MSAKFKPYKILSTQLNNLPIKEGQFIITTDTKQIYIDINGTSRVEYGILTDLPLYKGSSSGSLRTKGAAAESSTYKMKSNSFAQGVNTKVTNIGAHAEGTRTVASGNSSHAEGQGTIANGDYSHVEGKYNVSDTEGKYSHIVGNGTSSARSNAYTLDWNGNSWYSGEIKVGGSSFDDANAKTIATQEYVDNLVGDIGTLLRGI